MKVNILNLDNCLSDEIKNLPLLKPENIANQLDSYKNAIIKAKDKNKVEDSIRFSFKKLLEDMYNYEIDSVDRIDLVIKENDKIKVLIEAKRPSNITEMVSEDNFNTKAFHEVLRYFYNCDTKDETFINSIIITNGEVVYIFSSDVFKKILSDKNVKDLLKGHKSGSLDMANTTADVYSILHDFLNDIDITIDALKINLLDNDLSIDYLYKVLSPYYLWKKPLTNDANSLNEPFYYELLYILGLEEKINPKTKIAKLIISPEKNSMIGLTIDMIKSKQSEPFEEAEIENLALSLNILWINRILFLKLLESHLRLARGDDDFAILNSNLITTFSDLMRLFFNVLNKSPLERHVDEKEHAVFKYIPYLNSSLFTRTDEEMTYEISSLYARKLSPYSKTVIKEKRQLTTLEYLLSFLNCYQFNRSNEGFDEQTVIKSSVLGLIFEKLNGHKDGAHFTPASITMYMSKELLQNQLVHKFNTAFDLKLESYASLKNFANNQFYNEDVRAKACNVLDSITIIDPSVGSGHFLVSMMNELIAIRSELGLLPSDMPFRITIINDELHIKHRSNDEYFKYKAEKGKISDQRQTVQKYFFNLKKHIIQNQLYGVDINHDSVNICRLRLWVELLKSSYFKDEKLLELEVLPNLEFKVLSANSLKQLGIKLDLVFQKEELRAKMANYFDSYGAKKREYEKEIISYLDDVKNRLHDWNEHHLDDYNPFDCAMTKTYEFFDGELMFGVDKFDIVIGNPPYGVELEAEDVKLFKKRWPIGNTDTAALFTMLMLELLKTDGIGGYIVPKSFIYASNWAKLRTKVLPSIFEIADCGKAWKNVKLEMAIFMLNPLQPSSSYANYLLNDETFSKLGVIDKTACDEFGIIVNGLSPAQLELGRKIKNQSKVLNDFGVSNKRGAPLQKHATTSPDKYKALGGASIARYGCKDDVKGYISEEIFKLDKEGFIIKPNSILVQRMVAHIEKPYPQIKFIAMLSSSIKDDKKVIVDTINQLSNNGSLSSSYILALLHSKLLNWYAYLFVFARAIRTIQFDNPTSSVLPIFEPTTDEQKQTMQAIVSLVEQVIALKEEGHLTAELEDKIDQLVYGLYQLSPNEIAIIESKLVNI